ncbi:hypothetical protein WJX84_008258 [Apatococcus fuscideae]|uniref:Ricin B lectin domain-containing protein n=1 Tax=Apatococcus fuscideae TaxID=2026836 RepID=A0AAW1T0P9_9CHLO
MAVVPMQAESDGYAANCGIPDPSVDNPTYIIYNPSTNALSNDINFPLLANAWPVNLFPFLAILPYTGSVLVITGANVAAFTITSTGYATDTAWGTPINLPIPASYPQTATMVLLPLAAANNWAPQVLVVGGSSADCANPGTPASAYSYLINVAAGASHAPVREVMPDARVMGDCVVLPDGTIFCANGCGIGVAGGAPGYGGCSNPTTVGHIYDPTLAVNARWRRVADSLIARLYHSVSILTTNADVMVTGSEATEEYRVQIYTPPYLSSGFPRPVVVSAPEIISPGSRFPITWTGVDTIDRVVMSKMPGVTHSTHMDDRQLVLSCTSVATGTTAGTTTCSAAPDFTISTPGNYIMYILRNGMPSVGQACGGSNQPILQTTDDGSGRQRYSLVEVPGVVGQYYIVNQGRPGGCGAYLGAPTCASGTYILGFGPGDDGQCIMVLKEACGGTNTPDLYPMDDQSGRQHWSIVPVTGVAGQYYIVANGRPGTCGSYVSLPTCASGLNGVQFVAGDDGSGLQRWAITSQALPTTAVAAQTIPNGNYQILVQNCEQYLYGPNCPTATPQPMLNQTGDATTIWTVTLVAGTTNQFTLASTNRAGCTAYLSAPTCASGLNTNTFAAADDGTGAQRWMLTAATNNYMVYEIQNVARAACANYLSCPGCGNGAFADLYNIDDNSGRQQWRFAHT